MPASLHIRAPLAAAAAVCLAVLPPAPPLLAHVGLDRQIEDVGERIRRDPDDAVLHMRRGELHRVRGSWEAAHADYERARRLDPALAAVDLCLGRMFLQAGRAGEALAPLDRYLAARPVDAEAHAARARVLVRLGRPAEAAADYERAAAAFAPNGPPPPDWFLEWAGALAAAGDAHLARAVEVLDEGLRRVGPAVTLTLLAADLDVRAGRVDEALRRIDEAASRSARKESWLARRGALLEASGRTAEAAEAYRGALAAIERLPAPRRSTRMAAYLEAEIRRGLALTASR